MAQDPKQLTKDTKGVFRATLEGMVPPAAGLLALADRFSSRGRAKKFDWYTTELVEAMGLEGQRELLVLIEQNQDEGWCAEGFEQGFRAVMSAVDEAAKKCALIMIADYFTRHDAPDRIYKQFANLLSEADQQVLRAIHGMAEAVRTLGDDWVVFSKMHELDHSADFFQARNQTEGAIRLPPLADLSIMYTAADLLRRHHFLATPSIMERSLPRTQTIEHDAYLGTMLPHHRPLWERLRVYLAPLRTP
jgi:hypothetical protein